MARKERFMTSITTNDDKVFGNYNDGAADAFNLTIPNIEYLYNTAMEQVPSYKGYVLKRATTFAGVVGFIGVNMLFSSMISDINFGNFGAAFWKAAGAFALTGLIQTGASIYSNIKTSKHYDRLDCQANDAFIAAMTNRFASFTGEPIILTAEEAFVDDKKEKPATLVK